MFHIAFRKDVFFRAFKMALIVGIVLAIINHGDHIFLGTMTVTNWIKILITFCVPFCVTLLGPSFAKIRPPRFLCTVEDVGNDGGFP